MIHNKGELKNSNRLSSERQAHGELGKHNFFRIKGDKVARRVYCHCGRFHAVKFGEKFK